MKRFAYIYIAALITGIFAATSCTYEEKLTPEENDTKGMSEISFTVDLPQTKQITTKSETGTVAENKIQDIYVLVFDKTTEDLISKSKGRNLVAAGTHENKITFKATLPVGKEYIFMVLANAGNRLDGIHTGSSPQATKADVMNVTANETGRWDTATAFIPMWGEQTLTLTASSTPVFELTRMLARINVEVNLNDITPGVPADNFQLTSIRYYNYNTAGTLVPDINTYDLLNKYVMSPTIPASPGTQEGALVYDETYISENKECKEQIYVFEAEHNGNTYHTPANNSEWIKNPCLVIGGKYKTGNGTWLEETFYRIDFIRKDRTDPQDVKEIWLSILRNFTYNVVITEVSGSGFPDPDIALESAPINMEANILDWNESGMGEIVFDGTFYLSVSRDEVLVGRGAVNDKREENIVYIKTDYIHLNNPNHANSGWYVEKYVDAADETTPVTWLRLNPERGAPNDRVEAWFTYEANNTDDTRTAIVWIAAGRLRYPIHVTQGVFSIEIVDPVTGVPLSELRFEVPAAGIPQESKSFQVVWGPASRPVTIEQTSPKSWSPFDPGWITPNPSPGWTLTGSGSQIYQVTAPTVSAALIEQDPFYERESVYSFTLGNGVDIQTASITLHQIYYNIEVETYVYTLDGNTYSLSVHSNTEWRISKVEEWLHNIPPDGPQTPPVLLDLKYGDNLKVGTVGGPNVNGESVSFTVVNNHLSVHEDKWGTVYVTFESPDGKFQSIRVPLSFPSKSKTVLGLGYALDVRGYNPAKGSPYHNKSFFSMLSNENNFGRNANSVVKVDHLKIIAHNCQVKSRIPTGSYDDNFIWGRGDLKKWLNLYNPDVITISYSVLFNSEEAQMIKKYLESGGSVIMYYGGDLQINADTKPLFDLLFNHDFSYATATYLTNTADLIHRIDYPNTGSVFQLENVDDPILNGPFGDIRGKYWGAHYSRVGLRESVIGDKVHILSKTDSEQNSMRTAGNRTDPGYINMFRHKEYNLFWVGNGMGTATYYDNQLPAGYYEDPNYVNLDGTPGIREGYGAYGVNTPRYELHGAYLFANAMAWALSVTHHTPPPGGY